MRALRLLLVCVTGIAAIGCSGAKVQVLPQNKSAGTGSAEMLESHFRMADGYELPYVGKWPKSEPKALVLALHGFNDYSKAFEGMCDYLSINGIACIAYDQRGFGQTAHQGIWPGAGVLQADLQAIVSLLKARFAALPLYLVGESMGGAVIMTARDGAMAQYISGSVLLAPAVWGRATQPWYQRWLLWLAVHTVPGWMPTGEGLEIQATDNIEALREMSRDPWVIKATRIDAIYGLNNLMDRALSVSPLLVDRTLVLYGQKDEVIPVLPTCKMLESIEFSSGARAFKLYPNGYHMLSRDLQAEQVFRDVRLWVEHMDSARLDSEGDRQRLCSSQSG